MTGAQPPTGQKKRQRAARGQVYAAIDLGTNNCRLLIATQGRDGNLRVLDSFSRAIKLGEGVASSGGFGEAAIARTVEALKICGERVRARGVRHVRAIATEACRRARNADALIARAAREADVHLAIVSPEEEARLAAVGCAPLIGEAYEGALIFDIGGGSTEIIWMRRAGDEPPCTVQAASLPVGVVTLAEEHAGCKAPYRDMFAEMRARFAPLRAAMAGFPAATHHLLGTSGTVTTLAAIALGLQHYVRGKVDASWHDCAGILSIVERLAELNHDGLARIGVIGADRADLALPGCAIFAAIHAHWPCAQLRVADRGLREGIIRDLIAQDAGRA
jgi:exopolyphosphatase / guanosine-5'-triphosphate,3'-diphosphate pyrophosphatase